MMEGRVGRRKELKEGTEGRKEGRNGRKKERKETKGGDERRWEMKEGNERRKKGEKTFHILREITATCIHI